jgi:hypothetical protein
MPGSIVYKEDGVSEQNANERELKEYGQSWEIAAALWDGPKTLPEIVDHFYSYIRMLGLFRVTRRWNAVTGRWRSASRRRWRSAAGWCARGSATR